MDIDSIRPGADFVTEIEGVIASSDIVLALIGPFWAVSRDGRRRLDEPQDPVRQEIAAALAAWRKKRTHLIPVLAPGAPVPTEGELPPELRGVERINAVKLSDEYWRASMEALFSSVEASRAPVSPPPTPPEAKAALAPARPAVKRPRERSPSTPPPPEHFVAVAGAISQGRVAFLLGPGVNPSEPDIEKWEPGVSRFPPSSRELAAHLAHELHLDDLLDMDPLAEDLGTVADYAETMLGSAPLYDAMRAVFAADYTPTPVHRVLARLPRFIQANDSAGLLFATLSYDDILERALDAEGETYDVLSYAAAGEHRGKFVHYSPEHEPIVIERPNEYVDVLAERPVIVKLLGGINRLDPDRDSYVVSEGDQMNYAMQADFPQMIPVTVAAILVESNLLFLGTSPRERRFRIVLEKMFGGRRLPNTSWAVQRDPDLLSRGEWKRRGVEVLDLELAEYVERLMEVLEDTFAPADER